MNQQANEYLILAVKGSNHDIVKKALQQGADINVSCDEGSLVHSAIINKKDDFIDTLVENGADLNRVNKGFYTAFDLAVDNGLFDIANNLLKKRKLFNKDLFTNYVDICMNNYSLKDGEKASKENQQLLAHYASRITGEDIAKLLNSTERSVTDVYLVHLLEYAYAEKNGRSLENWHEKNFLSLRIHAFLELLVKLKRGVIQTHHEEDYQRINVVAHLQHELLHEIETLRTIKDRDRIYDSLFTDEEKEELYTTLAKRVLDHIVSLEVGNSYTQDSGWPAHNIYISFTKANENLIQVRVDNLGPGSDEHPKNEKGLKPFDLSQLRIDNISEIEALERYILLILKGKNNWDTSFALAKFSTDEVSRLKELIGGSFSQIQAIELENNAHKKIPFVDKETSKIKDALYKIGTKETKNLTEKLTWADDIAKDTIYDRQQQTIRKHFDRSTDYPRLPEQTSDNCVRAAYEVGLLIRSYEPSFYEWLQCEEKTIVINPRRAKYTKDMDHDYYWNNEEYLVKNSNEFKLTDLCNYYQFSQEDLLGNLPELDRYYNNEHYIELASAEKGEYFYEFDEDDSAEMILFLFFNRNHDYSLKKCEKNIKELGENIDKDFYLLKAYLTFLMIEYKIKESSEYITAIDYFEKYLNVPAILASSSPNLLFMLATAYGKWGDQINNISYHMKARDIFLSLTDRGQTTLALRAAAYYNYGVALQKLGKHEKAIFEYIKADKIYSDIKDNLDEQATSWAYSDVLSVKANIDKHIEFYNTTFCEVVNKNAEVIHNLGFASYLTEKIQDAKDYFNYQSGLKIKILSNDSDSYVDIELVRDETLAIYQGSNILRKRANKRIINTTFGLGLIAEKDYRDSGCLNIDAKTLALHHFKQVIERDADFQEATNHINAINKTQPDTLQKTSGPEKKRNRTDAGLGHEDSRFPHKKPRQNNHISNPNRHFNRTSTHKKDEYDHINTSSNRHKRMGQ